MVNRSVFFKPSEIGTLPDQEEHHVSFKAGHPAYLLSEPKLIREKSKMRKLLDDDLLEGFWRYPIIDGSRDSLYKLANDLLGCIKERVYEFAWVQPEVIEDLAQLL